MSTSTLTRLHHSIQEIKNLDPNDRIIAAQDLMPLCARLQGDYIKLEHNAADSDCPHCGDKWQHRNQELWVQFFEFANYHLFSLWFCYKCENVHLWGSFE